MFSSAFICVHLRFIIVPLKVLLDFPDPRFHTDEDGIVGWSGTDALTPENLINAYRNGIFPWTISGYPFVPWHCPPERAILEFENLHVGASVRKEQRKGLFEFTIDRAFKDVIKNCARVKRSHEAGTWITGEMIRAYVSLHRLGHAHSVEAWHRETGELVGGLYGVDAGGVFCGESMFHLHPNASKLALLHLIEHLRTRGASWLDAQVMTPHIERLGAGAIAREKYLDKLGETLAQGLKLF